MGDLKTFWQDPVYPNTSNLSGAGVVSSGSDPNAGGNPGPAALQPLWNNPPVPVPGNEESGNSVSGLPSLPNRCEPAETPPEPPDLTTRSPGTIDKR